MATWRLMKTEGPSDFCVSGFGRVVCHICCGAVINAVDTSSVGSSTPIWLAISILKRMQLLGVTERLEKESLHYLSSFSLAKFSCPDGRAQVRMTQCMYTQRLSAVQSRHRFAISEDSVDHTTKLDHRSESCTVL